MRMAMLLLPMLLGGATVEQVTPATGGETRYWTLDYSLIVGETYMAVDERIKITVAAGAAVGTGTFVVTVG